MLFPAGLLWVLASRRNASLQDLIVRTAVVYDWAYHPADEAYPTSAGGEEPSGGHDEGRLDTQADLTNERTYLAWLRTGLALMASGVAAERVLPAEGIVWARQLIGVTLILAGVVTAAFARRRWQSVDRALRAGRPVPGRSWATW